MEYIGIDIGSTAAKVVVLNGETRRIALPTGWSSVNTAEKIREQLSTEGIDVERAAVVATGYGRAAVAFADKQITEITCHAAGCAATHPTCTVIDVGGQDTKVISIQDGSVVDFYMNDKCSAGTGKFIEVMANRLECDIDELFSVAQTGDALQISALCTVFAESEIINYIGAGKKRSDIAAGIVDSVASKVAGMTTQATLAQEVLLTGGLSHLDYFAQCIGEKIGQAVTPLPHGRFAGAYGAAVLAKRQVDKGEHSKR